MNKTIDSAVASGHGKAVLIAGFLGLVFSDIIPTPGDALYFYDQRRLRKKLDAGLISAKQFWVKNAMGYYLYNSAWWSIVFGVVMLSKGDFNHKIKLALALSGSGAVIGVIARNIKSDSALSKPALSKSLK